MNRKFLKRQYNLFSIAAGCVLLNSIPVVAHAELSIGALLGLADYTTDVRGDALYAYGGPGGYFKYNGDINSNDLAAGIVARYLYPFHPCMSFGLETGYVYINQDTTRLRADDLLPGPTSVENFTTKSNGLVLLNLVFKWEIVPSASLSIFTGPAWLDTEYIADDFHDNYKQKVDNLYELTADLGVEAEWKVADDWSVGMRLDYIFDTDNTTVATTGSAGDALYEKTTAKSHVLMATATLRYIIPCI